MSKFTTEKSTSHETGTAVRCNRARSKSVTASAVAVPKIAPQTMLAVVLHPAQLSNPVISADAAPPKAAGMRESPNPATPKIDSGDSPASCGNWTLRKILVAILRTAPLCATAASAAPTPPPVTVAAPIFKAVHRSWVEVGAGGGGGDFGGGGGGAGGGAGGSDGLGGGSGGLGAGSGSGGGD